MKIQAVMNKVFGSNQHNWFKDSKSYFQDLQKDSQLDFLSFDSLLKSKDKDLLKECLQLTDTKDVGQLEENIECVSFEQAQ